MQINTIKQDVTIELIEKRSRFITNAFNVNSRKEAEEKIKEIKKKYYDAKHNCFAFVVIESGEKVVKTSDDGEPAGTAGMPILNAIEKNDLSNILIIVTRYFGGILLGTGGLTRIYSKSSTEVIKNAEIVKNSDGVQLNVKIGYNDNENFRYYCDKNNIKIVNIEFNEDISYIIELSNEEFEKIKNIINQKNNEINFNIIHCDIICRKIV